MMVMMFMVMIVSAATTALPIMMMFMLVARNGKKLPVTTIKDAIEKTPLFNITSPIQ